MARFQVNLAKPKSGRFCAPRKEPLFGHATSRFARRPGGSVGRAVGLKSLSVIPSTETLTSDGALVTLGGMFDSQATWLWIERIDQKKRPRRTPQDVLHCGERSHVGHNPEKDQSEKPGVRNLV